MATKRNATEVLGRFKPIRVLWEGAGAPFPSEQSARWALRDIRGRLAEADALAYHRGRLQVDIEKAAAVIREAAVEKARKRYSA